MAEDCLSVARRMSLHSDRERMEAMARRWIDLAEQTEGAVAFPAPDPTQQPQPQQSKLEPEE
jgi:hypothetical protein